MKKILILITFAILLTGCIELEENQIPVKQCNIEKNIVANTFKEEITKCESYSQEIETLKQTLDDKNNATKLIPLCPTTSKTNTSMTYLVMLNRLKFTEERLEDCYMLNDTTTGSNIRDKLNNCELKLNKTLDILN